MNLAGQLVIGKARITQISDRLKKSVAEKDFADTHDGVGDLFEAIHLLDRISDGIQQGVMNMRMLPIGPLFSRFHRVIRDLTRGNGKEIHLEISGEGTELDKRMIDELGDPMIHIIRNAADHGIESPEARIAAGKPRHGTISLCAFHRGSNIIIQVSDDGHGLDTDRIRAKAIERGIVSPADAERMTPREIHQLIWLPGFSTAEKVTEVSGRGVGMDIVRSKIEELNGSIDVDSELGRGTTLTIKLPLTLAILPSLMVEIDGDVFAVPLESVAEIVSIGREEIHTVQGRPMASVRDRVVPILTLGRVFNWRQEAKKQTAEESQRHKPGDYGRRKPAAWPRGASSHRRRGRRYQVDRRQLSQRRRHRRGQHPRRRPRVPDPRSACADRNVITLRHCRGGNFGETPMTHVDSPADTKIHLFRELFASATHDASTAMCRWTNSLIRLTLDEVCEMPLEEAWPN